MVEETADDVHGYARLPSAGRHMQDEASESAVEGVRHAVCRLALMREKTERRFGVLQIRIESARRGNSRVDAEKAEIPISRCVVAQRIEAGESAAVAEGEPGGELVELIVRHGVVAESASTGRT